MSKAANALKEVQVQMAETISRETGASVEITVIGEDSFTISGPENDVKIAAHYFYTHNLGEVAGSVYEDGIKYCYVLLYGETMRGGQRPNSGAKPKPHGSKRRRFLISLSPEAAAKWEQVKPGERSAMVESMLLGGKE